MSKQLDPIITPQIDIYDLLSISYDATESEIRKSYRRTALKYHPDKNKSSTAPEMFHLLGIAVETLLDDELRKKYDGMRQLEIEKANKIREMDISRRQMKEELEKSEQEAKKDIGTDFKRRLEILKQQGLQMRRNREEEILGMQHKQTPKVSKENENDRTIRVKWTIKKEKVTEKQLFRFFSEFGEVEKARISSSERHRRYNYGTVIFKTASVASKAVHHNYKKDIHRWVNSSVEFFILILRSVQWAYDNNSHSRHSTNNGRCSKYDQMPFLEYKDMTLKRLEKIGMERRKLRIVDSME